MACESAVVEAAVCEDTGGGFGDFRTPYFEIDGADTAGGRRGGYFGAVLSVYVG